MTRRLSMHALAAALGLALPACQLVLPFAGNAEADEVLCSNGLDDDADGAVDCADAECDAFCIERTPALCRNGIDDDASGGADCDDPKCDGMCPEESPEHCRDGRDQDGDGLVDLDDPSCWPEATTRVERCTSQRGGGWIAQFEGEDDGWLAVEGEIAYVPDPTGRFPHDVLELSSASEVVNASVVTGGIDGLYFSTSVLLPSGAWVELTLEPPLRSTIVPRAPERISVVLTHTTMTASMYVDGELHSEWREGSFAPGWYDFTLTIEGSEVALYLGPVRQLSFAYPGELSSSAGYRLRIIQPGAGLHLAAAEINRPYVDPCGEEVPAFDQPSHTSNHLSAASAGDVVCAIGYEPLLTQLGALSFRSDDGGRTFGEPSVVVGSTGDGVGGLSVRSPCVSIAYDAAAREFVGIAHAFTPTSQTTYLVRSADCLEWSAEPVTAPEAWPPATVYLPGCAAYSVVGDRHELWTASVDDDGIALERYWSEGRLRPDEPPTRDPPIRIPSTGHGWANVTATPGDLLIAGGVADRFEVAIVDRVVHEARPWLAIAPSLVEGACDAQGVGRAALLAGRDGAIAHPCRTELGAFQTVVQRLSIAAPQ